VHLIANLLFYTTISPRPKKIKKAIKSTNIDKQQSTTDEHDKKQRPITGVWLNGG
jgi:hypothetical protein